MIENLNKTTLKENLHTIFRVFLADSSTLELELIEVTVLPSARQQEQVSAIFRGPSDFLLPQAIYPMEHEKLGEFGLFLVPVGKDQKGIQYEAFFNRIGVKEEEA